MGKNDSDMNKMYGQNRSYGISH